MASTSFVDLCDACVKSITESDDLALEESVVYEAVIRWSEAEFGRQGLEVTDTNRREVLGDIIYTVRFPIMEHAYFKEKVLVTDILSLVESRDIIRYYEDSKRFPCKEISQNNRKGKTKSPIVNTGYYLRPKKYIDIFFDDSEEDEDW